MGAKPLRIFLLAAGLLAPLALLFSPAAAFYGDWDVNLWLVGMQGEFLRSHGHFPAVLNLQAAVGLPVPVFYGYGLYPGLGLFSALLGAARALRLGLLLLLALEGYALLSAGRNVFRDRRLAWVVAASVLWSVYSLTNLYNRSAVAEYFGSGFFVSALAFAVAAAAEPASARRHLYAWLAGLCAVLAGASHPPTALLAAPCLLGLGLLLAAGWACYRPGAARSVLVAFVAPLLLGAAALAPWAYATARWSRRLGIVGNYGGLSYYPDRSDSLLGRFSPLPYDALALRQGTAGVSTPYLEAPVIAGLLVLLALNLGLLFRLRRDPRPPAASAWEAAAGPALVVALAGFLVFTALSLFPLLAAPFRFLGAYLQFAYRLVSFSNASLLLGVFASGAAVARRGGFACFPRLTGAVALAALVLTAVGWGIKMDHAARIAWQCRAPEFTRAGAKAALARDGFGRFAGDYATPGRYAEVPAGAAAMRLDLPVSGAPLRFDAADPVAVTLPAAGWALTNVVAFPWNDLRRNGRRIPAAELARFGNFFAVWLPAGPSTLQWVWRPDPYWAALRQVGGVAALLLVLASFGVVAHFGTKRLRASPPVSP